MIEHPVFFLLAAIAAASFVSLIGHKLFADLDDFFDCRMTWYVPIWLNVWRAETEDIHLSFLEVAPLVVLSLLLSAVVMRACSQPHACCTSALNFCSATMPA